MGGRAGPGCRDPAPVAAARRARALALTGAALRPIRGHARSHRDRAGPKTCGEPVGAGVPAKRPAQAQKSPQRRRAS
ncbi:hypothetical protein F1602_24415 [Pseudomonas putida]|nr:hypothetical protein HV87_05555 [Pseudomonas aeruginosa]QEQ90268.1 hypothetical protein F1602_24415 [Pseudomonas putida]